VPPHTPLRRGTLPWHRLHSKKARPGPPPGSSSFAWHIQLAGAQPASTESTGARRLQRATSSLRLWGGRLLWREARRICRLLLHPVSVLGQLRLQSLHCTRGRVLDGCARSSGDAAVCESLNAPCPSASPAGRGRGTPRQSKRLAAVVPPWAIEQLVMISCLSRDHAHPVAPTAQK
jgi:hypothetical protein